MPIGSGFFGHFAAAVSVGLIISADSSAWSRTRGDLSFSMTVRRASRAGIALAPNSPRPQAAPRRVGSDSDFRASASAAMASASAGVPGAICEIARATWPA